MILGLGSDLVDIRRIERAIERHQTRFLDRIFTQGEQEKAARRPLLQTAVLAKRFAAKEACAKALGTGFREGISWLDMEVITLPSGQPSLKLSGNALKRLHVITPDHMNPHIAVSLTDEPPLAHAIVIISAVPVTAKEQCPQGMQKDCPL